MLRPDVWIGAQAGMQFKLLMDVVGLESGSVCMTWTDKQS